MNHCIGIDIGGTTVKASVFDLAGTELGTASAHTPVATDEVGKVERDLTLTWKAIVDVVIRARERARVAASSIAFVSTTGHGKGAYLRFAGDEWPSVGIVSSDNRARAVAERLGSTEEYKKTILPKVTQPLWPAHSSALLAWLRTEQPERYKRIDRVLFAKDFVTAMLTGRTCTDYTDATGSGLYRTRDHMIDDNLLDYFGLSALRSALPTAVPSHETVGGLRKGAADATGLVEGTPVVAGLFDVNAAALASAVKADEELGLVVGTWNIAEALTTAPERFSRSWNRIAVQSHCTPGEWLIHEGSPTSAGNLEWFVRTMFTRSGENIYEEINRHVETTARASAMFFPYIYGSHGNLDASGTFIGLKSGTTTGEVLRAIYEGITFQLYEHASLIRETAPGVRHLRLAGGAKRSRPWVQLIADVFGLPVSVSPTEEIGALGAAMCGAVGVGAYRSYADAVHGMTRFNDPIQPNRAEYAALQRRYELFLAVRERLSDVWETFNASVV